MAEYRSVFSKFSSFMDARLFLQFKITRASRIGCSNMAYPSSFSNTYFFGTPLRTITRPCTKPIPPLHIPLYDLESTSKSQKFTVANLLAKSYPISYFWDTLGSAIWCKHMRRGNPRVARIIHLLLVDHLAKLCQARLGTQNALLGRKAPQLDYCMVHFVTSCELNSYHGSTHRTFALTPTTESRQ